MKNQNSIFIMISEFKFSNCVLKVSAPISTRYPDSFRDLNTERISSIESCPSDAYSQQPSIKYHYFNNSFQQQTLSVFEKNLQPDQGTIQKHNNEVFAARTHITTKINETFLCYEQPRINDAASRYLPIENSSNGIGPSSSGSRISWDKCFDENKVLSDQAQRNEMIIEYLAPIKRYKVMNA